MERDPAELIRRLLTAGVSLALALSVGLTACGGDDGDGGDRGDRGDGGANAVTSTTGAPDADEFCDRLIVVMGDDPFDDIFGHDNPMDAAAAFDGGQVALDALVEVAPGDIAPAAESYRDALAGFRDLILPSATIDADTYEAEFDSISAQRDQAVQTLDAHLTAECDGAG